MENMNTNQNPEAAEQPQGHEPESVEASIIDEAEAVVAEALEADAQAAEAEAAPSAEEQIAAAQAEAKEWQDKFMRLHAEWDTYRRRTTEQRAVEKKLAAEKLITDLLPVIDDMERSIDFAKTNGETGMLGGVEAVCAKFVDILGRSGMEAINPAGEAFDSLEAQAVAAVPNPDVYDETVMEVYQKGYKIGTKVLRPAMVVVATGGPRREKEEQPSA